MWRRTNLRAAILGLALLSAGCDTDRGAPTGAPSLATTPFVHSPTIIYTQREFLGNPLVSEVTIVKAQHERYNKLSPFILTDEFRSQTAAFVTGVAGRPTSVASTLGAVLYPDVLVVQHARPGSTAGWLSWALADGYGGRKLTDDVVDAGLLAIFGPLLSPVNVSPGLSSDNIGANDKPFLSTFPYLAPPHLPGDIVGT